MAGVVEAVGRVEIAEVNVMTVDVIMIMIATNGMMIVIRPYLEMDI